jgi:hypothetical protein
MRRTATPVRRLKRRRNKTSKHHDSLVVRETGLDVPRKRL